MKLDLLLQLTKPSVHDVPVVPITKKPINIGLYPNFHQGQNISDTSPPCVPPPYTGHLRTHTENPISTPVSHPKPSSFEKLKTTGHPGHIGHRKNKEITFKKDELTRLIKQISDHHGGDDKIFLSEYIADVLSNNDIDDALICFHDLAKHLPAFCRK